MEDLAKVIARINNIINMEDPEDYYRHEQELFSLWRQIYPDLASMIVVNTDIRNHINEHIRELNDKEEMSGI